MNINELKIGQEISFKWGSGIWGGYIRKIKGNYVYWTDLMTDGFMLKLNKKDIIKIYEY